jgi:two-component system response regulator RegA
MLNTPETRKMLIVEDNEVFRDRLALAMQKRGFETQSCASVAEGLAAIAQNVPGYGVFDLRLLDGSGLEIVVALTARNPDARVIILTGYGDIPTAVAAARVGAADYLSKPATADEIVDVLMSPVDQNPPAPVDPMSPDEARLEHIEHVFHEAGDNVTRAARLLNLHRRTLQRVLRRHGVSTNATE